MWFFPIREKIDVADRDRAVVYPRKQDLVVDSQQFRETIVSAANAGTTITPIIVERNREPRRASIVGLDGQYMFTPMIGAGVFIRYNGGSVDLARRDRREGRRIPARDRGAVPVLTQTLEIAD